MEQTYSQRIQQMFIFQRHQGILVWDKGEVHKEESQELTQDEKSTGRMLKSKSDQDRQTDSRSKI